jgi:serralysin
MVGRLAWKSYGSLALTTAPDLANSLDASASSRWTDPDGRWFDVVNWGSEGNYFSSPILPSVDPHGGGCPCLGCAILKQELAYSKALDTVVSQIAGPSEFGAVALRPESGGELQPVFLGDAIGDTIGTAQTMSVNSSVASLIDLAGDLDVFRVSLVAGQTYTFSLERATWASELDSFLELYNSAGTFVLSDDDGGIFNNAQITFTATTSGNFYVVARAYNNESDGNYVLTVNNLPTGNSSPTTFPSNALTQYSYDQAAHQIGAAFDGAEEWPGDQASWSARYGVGATITYAFRSSGPTPMPGGTSGFSTFNSAQIAAAEAALAAWAAVANITFVRVDDGAGYSNNAQILFGNYSSGASGAAAFAFLPVGGGTLSASEGDVWVNSLLDENSELDPGGYGRHALLHEIGHALGLSHPGDYNASSGGGPINYVSHAEYYNDTRMFTVMSYFGSNFTGGNIPAFPTLPQLHDIAAMQRLYGANLATRTGDTIYGFNSNTGLPEYAIGLASQGAIFSIWDGGGLDTLDLSGYSTNSTIDLREEGFSSAGPGQTGNASFNISIARGAVIENGIGGSGSDTIHGNGANNTLTGNGNGDVLYGYGGADTLVGGAGIDFMAGGIGDDTYYIDSNSDNPFENSGEGYDIVYTSVSAGTTLNIEELRLQGSVLYGVGNAQNNIIRGNGANNELQGLDGDDTLYGAAGVDLLYGQANNDTLYGEADNDALIGDAGNDVLDGGTGQDYLLGGIGDDTYYVDNSGDNPIESSGQGNDTIYSAVSYAMTLNVETMYLTNSAPYGVGNSQNNIIYGNSAFNELQGLGGDDTLYGGDDFDLLYGQDDNDFLYGQVGDDALIGGNGNDLLDGGVGVDYLLGGGGNDSYYVDHVGDYPIESPGGGTDIIYASISYTITANVEELVLTGSALHANGNGENNTLRGNNLSNEIRGFGGDDRLIGGGATDFLYGGTGADTFVYLAASDAAPAALDAIMDFEIGVDIIDLMAVRTGSSDTFQLIESGGNTFLHVDLGGDGNDDMLINIFGVTGVTANDIFWIN